MYTTQPPHGDQVIKLYEKHQKSLIMSFDEQYFILRRSPI